jgi:hypothetical protein
MHARTLRFYPVDNLCRDLKGNKRELSMCGTDLPKYREKKPLAGASDIRVQKAATLNIPLAS